MNCMRLLLRCTAAAALLVVSSSCGIGGDFTHMSARDRDLIDRTTSCASLRSLAAGWQVNPSSNDGERARLNYTFKSEQQLKCAPPTVRS
jgi:hypothetical protein